MKILIATHNPAKKKALAKVLERLLPAVTFVSLDELGITEEPEEPGTTFAENARIKANYYSKSSGLPTVSDDGGIQIDALNGEPGIHSKRWLGRDASDDELIEYALERLSGVPTEKRTARFIVVLAFVDVKKQVEIVETAAVEGVMAERAATEWPRGFTYRALFKVKPYGKFYHQLTAAEYGAIDHRTAAAKRLAQSIRKTYGLGV